jgi:hypothetical protein
MIEFKEASKNELDKLLSEGWKILLVRSSPPGVAQPKQAGQVSIPPVKWNEKNQGFAWTFATERDGSEIPEFKAFIEVLKKGAVINENFKYSISKNGKFLQRVKVDKKQ